MNWVAATRQLDRAFDAFIIGLMRWLAILLVLVSVPADARPVSRPDWEGVKKDALKRRDRLYRDGYYKLPKPCKQTSSWDKYAKCQLKHAKNIEVLHQRDNVKLIAWRQDGVQPDMQRRQLELHFRNSAGWFRAGFHAETNATTELLGFSTFSSDRYRIDMGYASTTWVTLDEVNSRPARLRRQFTYLCSATAGCATVQVGCEVLVRGKAVASFRGVPVWDNNAIKIRGDATNTNRYCPKPPNWIAPVDDE
ncbi:MAG TPA: hypothetical protein VIV11_27480 [Kofleriaceae bacterium]